MLTPPVTVSGGVLAGRVDGDVCAYLGIPYAASTAGPARWRPPASAPEWSGTREAVAFGPDPIQPLRDDPYRRAPGISEDCLSLNIWKPARHPAPLPVMV